MSRLLTPLRSCARLCSAVLGCAQLYNYSTGHLSLGCSAARLLSCSPCRLRRRRLVCRLRRRCLCRHCLGRRHGPPPPWAEAFIEAFTVLHHTHARKRTQTDGAKRTQHTCMHNCYGLCLCVVECTVYVAMHAACIERCFSTPHFHPNDPIILPDRVC